MIFKEYKIKNNTIKMLGYIWQNEIECGEEEVCPISQEDVNINNLNDDRHKYIYIDNGTFAEPYSTDDLYEWTMHKNTNPKTRKPFTRDELAYINFYKFCSANYDNKESRMKEELDVGLSIPEGQLYKEFINLRTSIDNNTSIYTERQKSYINDYAKCSLKITDFQSHYKNNSNYLTADATLKQRIQLERLHAEAYLLRHPHRWVLRQSSHNISKDFPSGYLSKRGIKYYAISFFHDHVIKHALITHKLGHGWGVAGGNHNEIYYSNFIDALDHYHKLFDLKFSGHVYNYIRE